MTTRDKPAPISQQPRKTALGKGITSLLGGAASSDDSERLHQRSPRVDLPMAAESTNPRSNTPAPMVDASGNSVAGHVLRLRIHDIEPNPHQPRKLFDDRALYELAASLKHDGVLQPVVVSRSEDHPGKFVLIAGERRWRASKINGFETIPAIVKDGVAQDMLRLALIENIQRADLNVIEEAEAYESLIKDYGLTQEQCGERVGKDRTTVTNALRLLALPREVQDDLLEQRLTMGHGRALLSLEEKKLVLRARDIVIKKGLSVRQTEQLCKSIKSGGELNPTKATEAVQNLADLEYLADTLRSHLKTKVKIVGTANRGKIDISFFSAAELERLLRVIGPRTP